jgi:hypothetical protein
MQSTRLATILVCVFLGLWPVISLASEHPPSEAVSLSDPTIIIAILGASVTIIGWAVTSIYGTIHESSTRRQIARLDHLRRRIEELYGPLIGIIRQSFVVYEVATRVLPTNANGDLDQSQFQGKDIDAWRFFQERYFSPLNAEAVILLKTKTHLIGHEIPKSFEEFLRHATQFECLYQLWHSTGFDSSGKAKGIGWPDNFYNDVSGRFDSIRGEYAKTLELLDL